jgi:2-(1,2-epoxy-1,2-dihydrophenyl)acetyl-CoA isomerase
MSFNTLEVERQGSVAVIRLNDLSTLNALTMAMIDDVQRALDTLVNEARALIFTGAGRAFCSGAALNKNLERGDGAEPDYGVLLHSHVNPLFSRLRELPIPWISSVRGPAAGVGCSLALAADMIVASETACFIQAFAKVGLVPDGGSSYLLSRAIGRVRAMEMMLLGDKVEAGQALDWGLINRVVPDEQLEDTAMKIALRLADGPTLSLGHIRRNAWKALDDDWDTALRAEREAQKAVSPTEDVEEGIAAFMEKRTAKFRGR